MDVSHNSNTRANGTLILSQSNVSAGYNQQRHEQKKTQNALLS